KIIVAQFRYAAPRVNAAAKERFVFPDVADPGNRSLVHDGVTDGQLRAKWVAQSAKRFLDVEVIVDEVGAEGANGAVVLQVPLFKQFDDGRAEVHDDRIIHLEHEPRLVFWFRPRIARFVDVPGAVHTQVPAQRESVTEADDQVLALRSHTRTGLPHDAVHLRNGTG